QNRVDIVLKCIDCTIVACADAELEADAVKEIIATDPKCGQVSFAKLCGRLDMLPVRDQGRRGGTTSRELGKWHAEPLGEMLSHYRAAVAARVIEQTIPQADDVVKRGGVDSQSGKPTLED